MDMILMLLISLTNSMSFSPGKGGSFAANQGVIKEHWMAIAKAFRFLGTFIRMRIKGVRFLILLFRKKPTFGFHAGRDLEERKEKKVVKGEKCSLNFVFSPAFELI